MNIDTYKENISRIAQYLHSGEKKDDELKLGLEYEHIITESATEESVDYFNEHGIKTILEELSPLYDERVVVDKALCGLKRKGVSVSIEPAGQLEFSIDPYSEIKEILDEYEKAFSELNEILCKYSLKAVYLGYHPVSRIDELQLVPKKRYEYMYSYFKQTGKLGDNMMKGSASVQISIDYTDEKDFSVKLKLAEILGLFFAFMFDNTPIFEGEKAPGMMRTRIWDDTDSSRCGLINGSLCNDFGYEAYARYIYNSPSLYTLKDKEYSYTADKPLYEVFKDKLMDEDEIVHALGMVFPNVRAKRYLEIRYVDCVPKQYAMGYIALIKNIFYNKDILAAYSKKFENFDASQYADTKAELMKNGWDAKVFNTDAHSFAEKLIYEVGKNAGEDRKYIQPCKKIVDNKLLLREERFFDMYDNLLEKQYMQLIKKERTTLCEELRPLRDNFAREALLYAHQEIKYLLCPKIITKKAQEDFRAIAEKTYDILAKVTEHYIKDKAYRQLFAFSSELEELIVSPCSYMHTIPIMRADIFYDEASGDFKFCEINTDGTSAMKENLDVSEAFLKTSVNKEFISSVPLESYDVIDALIDEILEVYAQSGGSAKRPTVAITDFTESATIPEFELIKQAFEKRGINAIVADVRQFSFKKEYLYFADKKIDIIYRRAVTDEIMRKNNEIEEFIKALKGSKTCIVGHTKTQIAHNKIIFSVLFRPETMSFLSKEENDFIQAHVPFTTALKNGNYDYNDVLLNKDNWVIKPSDMYGAKDVCVGLEFSDEQWKSVLQDGIKNGFLLQKYCNPYKNENMYFDDDEQLIKDEFNNLTGLYIFGGHLAGVYSRASVKNIISGPTGGFTVCSLKEK